MNRFLHFIFITTVIMIIAVCDLPSIEFNSGDAKSTSGFIENKGQLSGDILFYGRFENLNVIIKNDGIYFDHYSFDSEVQSGNVIKMGFDRIPESFAGQSAQQIKYNYLKGPKENWVKSVMKYNELLIKNLYKGIDIRFRTDNDKPAYDFIVNPGANPEEINLAFEGIEEIHSNEDQIILSVNDHTFLHDKLFIYQKLEDGTKKISGEFVTEGKNLKFKIGDYDKSIPLIIDPIVLSTFFGGTSEDVITGICETNDGCFYVSGYTSSEDLQTTPGAYKLEKSGDTDAFVAKFYHNGSVFRQEFCTYIGGGLNDIAYDMVSDVSGGLYVVGMTESQDFPVMNGFGISFSGEKDAFALKIKPEGDDFIYSNLFGGTKTDIAYAIDVDRNGKIWIAGETDSKNFLIKDAVQPQNNGQTDAFFTCIKSSGASVEFSTYYGGVGIDIAYDIDVNDDGDAAATGETTSATNFPIVPFRGWGQWITEKPYDYSHNGGKDAFVCKMVGSGGGLEFSTYFGGSADDIGRSVALDLDGSVFFAGETYEEQIEPTFPVSANAYQPKLNGKTEAFIAKVDILRKWGQWAKNQDLLFCTYLGGKNDDYLSAMKFIQDKSKLVIVGSTKSNDFPVSLSSNSLHSGGTDMFVTEMAVNASSLNYSRFYGGKQDDIALALFSDDRGDLFVAGKSNSDKLVQEGSLINSTFSGGKSDGLFFKYVYADLAMRKPQGNEKICTSSNYKIQWETSTFPDTASFGLELWEDNSKLMSISNNAIGREFNWVLPDTLRSGSSYKIKVYQRSGMNSINEIPFNILNRPRITGINAEPNALTLCEGETLELTAAATGDELVYKWIKDDMDLPNSNSKTLTIEKIGKDGGGYYSVFIDGYCPPDITSEPVYVTVIPATIVTKDPIDKEVTEFDKVEFKVESFGENLKYVWQKDKQDLQSEIKSTFTITSASQADTGYYRCIITGDCGKDTTAEAFLKVNKSTSVDELAMLGVNFEIYTDDDFNVSLSSKDTYQCRLHLYDNTGSMVKIINDNFTLLGDKSIKFQLDKYNQGLYWIVLEINDTRIAKKLIHLK